MPFLLLKKYPQIYLPPLFILLFAYMAGLILGLVRHPPAAILLPTVLFFVLLGTFCLVKPVRKLFCYPLALRKKRGGALNSAATKACGFSNGVKSWHNTASAALYFGVFLVGVLSINHYLYPKMPPQHISCWAQNQPLTVEGALYRPAEYLPQKTRLYVKAEWVWASQKKLPVTGNIILTIEDIQARFLRSDRIVFSSRLRRPRNFANPRGFDYVRWLAFQEIYVTGYVSKEKGLVRLGAPANNSWLRKIDAARNKIRNVIDDSVPPPSSFFLRALLLGERGIVPDDIEESFSRTGTAHLLAISGLHVGIVAAFFYFLFRRLLSFSERLLLTVNVPKLSALLALVPIFFYALLAGAGVSVQRAFIMAAAYIIALLLDRGKNFYHAIALAALAILIMQPPALMGASFQLSFAAVLGIVFFAPKIISILPQKDELLQKLDPPWWRNSKQKLIAFLAVTFSASLATGPLVAYHFNLVSISGLPANLLIVPLAGFLVVLLGLLGVLLIPFSSFWAGFVFHLAGSLSGFAIKAVAFLADLPGTGFLVSPPSLAGMLFFYLLLLSLTLWKFYAWPKKIILVPLLLLVVNAGYHHLRNSPQGLEVTFIDVGQGDSVLVRFPQGETMLVDGGGFSNQSFDVGKNIVAPFLLQQRIRRIDYLVLSHPHPDHYGGLQYVAENFFVGEFWTNGDRLTHPRFKELEKALAKNKAAVRKLDNSGPSLMIQGVKVDIIHPPPVYAPSLYSRDALLNDRSLVIKLSYGETSILLTGDILSSAEKSLLSSSQDISATALKLAHHGSAGSNSLAFIKAVHPQIAICSAGFYNPFNLPHPRIIKRLEEQGCEVYRTDLDGAVTLISNGKQIRVERARKNRAP